MCEVLQEIIWKKKKNIFIIGYSTKSQKPQITENIIGAANSNFMCFQQDNIFQYINVDFIILIMFLIIYYADYSYLGERNTTYGKTYTRLTSAYL